MDGDVRRRECFAYAATQDPYFRVRAKRAFGALRFLMDVTQGGMPALVRLVREPGLKQLWQRPLWDYWRHEKAKRNPFLHYVAEAMLKDAVFQDNGPAQRLSLNGAALPDTLDSLRRYPLDLVNWRMEELAAARPVEFGSRPLRPARRQGVTG